SLQPSVHLHPGCAVEWVGKDGQRLAGAGILNPTWHRDLGLKRGAVVAEIYFEVVADLAPLARTAYEPPSVFQESFFELSVVADDAASSGEPVAIVETLGLPELRRMQFLTVYRGETLPAGKKSISYKVVCAAEDGTLSGERLQTILETVVGALDRAGFPIRS